MQIPNENKMDQPKQDPCADEGSSFEVKAPIVWPKGTDADRMLLDLKNVEEDLAAMTKAQDLQDHDYCEKNVEALQQDDSAGSHEDCNFIKEQETTLDKAEEVSEVENSRRMMERILGGSSDWERKVKFMSYLGVVLKNSRRRHDKPSSLPYHWRYNLRARENSLEKSADEKSKLKVRSVSSGSRRRQGNKTTLKGSSSGNVRRGKPRDDDSKKAELEGTIRRSRRSKNEQRALHWSYNLRGQDVVNYKETKRGVVGMPSSAPRNRKTSNDARRLNPDGMKGRRNQVKEKQEALQGENGVKNKQVVRKRNGKKTTKTSGQCDEPRPSKRPKISKSTQV